MGESVLRALVADHMAGLWFSPTEPAESPYAVTCIYCHIQRPRKRPFHHLPDCPITAGRRALKQEAVS